MLAVYSYELHEAGWRVRLRHDSPTWARRQIDNQCAHRLEDRVDAVDLVRAVRVFLFRQNAVVDASTHVAIRRHPPQRLIPVMAEPSMTNASLELARRP